MHVQCTALGANCNGTLVTHHVYPCGQPCTITATHTTHPILDQYHLSKVSQLQLQPTATGGSLPQPRRHMSWLPVWTQRLVHRTCECAGATAGLIGASNAGRDTFPVSRSETRRAGRYASSRISWSQLRQAAFVKRSAASALAPLRGSPHGRLLVTPPTPRMGANVRERVGGVRARTRPRHGPNE